MIVVKKKIKKPLLLAILAGTLVLLVAAALILNAVLSSKNTGGNTEKPKVEYDESLGEYEYSGEPVAFPRIERVNMDYISIIGSDSKEFGFIRDSEWGELVMYYTDERGNINVYLPSILYTTLSGIEKYSELYALEQNDNFGSAPKLTYLCNAIGTAYFTARIELSADEAVRAKELEAYGLADSDNPVQVMFTGTEKIDGKEKKVNHKLIIGDRLVTGQGYYYMVDDRSTYVYTSNSLYLDYVFLTLTDYINPNLVAAGLAGDNAFEPYLTTDFTHWKNTLYDKDGTEDLNKDGVPDGNPDTVKDGSEVTVSADVYRPNTNDTENGGYSVSRGESISFDLASLSKLSGNERLIKALVGKNVGLQNKNIKVTVPTFSTSRELNLSDDVKDKYKYEIIAVESILTDDGEIDEAGVSVGDNDLIKVVYKVYVNGEGGYYDLHGIIDLSNEVIPEDAKAKLRLRTVGSYSEDRVVFEVDYDDKNAVVVDGTIVITEIVSIVDAETKENLDSVRDDARVIYKYYIIVDGRTIEGSDTNTIIIWDGLEGEDVEIANALRGKYVGEYKIEINADYYYEAVSSFVTYDISSIKFFTTKELVVSFAYEQASKRDPYYGESFYINTMDNKYSVYALNAASCEGVVRIFGGLLLNAAKSEGLVGSATVDIGITPDKLYKYGLYANTVYFELPRGIKADLSNVSDLDSYLNSLDDYTYYGTLGFTLYISDPDPETGKRYIASDLYDVIATIDGENFIFLDQHFLDFYARRNLVITNISNISEMNFEFFMSDLYGSYKNELQHNYVWAYNGKYYAKENLTEAQLPYATEVDMIQVIVDPSGECSDSELSKFLADKGYDKVSLYEFYDKKAIPGDTLGTSYFKEVTETLFYTFYEGTLSEERVEAELDSESLVMRLTVKLDEVEGYKYYYTYEFYRISDREVVVRISKIDSKTNTTVIDVSDFYISTFSFKKFVSKYVCLLNREAVDNDDSYYYD